MRTLSHGSTARFPLAACLAALALMPGGCVGSGGGSVADARRMMQQGDMAGACSLLEQSARRQGPRTLRLEAVRLLVDCLNRTGQVERAAGLLQALSPPALRRYGEAMLTVARGPAELPAALTLLEQAEALWPEEAELPYRAGLLLLTDDQAARALPLLQRACRAQSSAACQVTLAHALLDLGRGEEALEQVRDVPLLEPRPAELARGRLLIKRLEARQGRVPPEVRAGYQHALQLLRQQDRPADCLQEVEALVLEHPRLGVLHTLLGLAHIRLANPAESVVALRRAAELNPWDATNPFYLALIFHQRRQWDPVVSHLTRAVALDPFHLRATRMLGETLLQLRRGKEAARVLDRLVALDPRSPLPLRLAARAHQAAGDLARAEASFRRLQARIPADFEANLRLAQVLLQRSKQGAADRTLLEQARRHLALAASVRPSDPNVARLREALGGAR